MTLGGVGWRLVAFGGVGGVGGGEAAFAAVVVAAAVAILPGVFGFSELQRLWSRTLNPKPYTLNPKP